jgi:hypothetical protein
MLALNAEIILTDWQLDPIRRDVRRYPPIPTPIVLTGAGMAIVAAFCRVMVSSIVSDVFRPRRWRGSRA